MLGGSLLEFVAIVLIILLLSMTNLWPKIVRGLRDLRGDYEEPAPSNADLELSFKLLGVSPSAAWEEIERAYRQKAKVHHPDKGGDADAMRALNDAYALLKRIKKAR